MTRDGANSCISAISGVTIRENGSDDEHQEKFDREWGSLYGVRTLMQERAWQHLDMRLRERIRLGSILGDLGPHFSGSRRDFAPLLVPDWNETAKKQLDDLDLMDMGKTSCDDIVVKISQCQFAWQTSPQT